MVRRLTPTTGRTITPLWQQLQAKKGLRREARLENAVIRLPGCDPASIAHGLAAALSDHAGRTAAADAARTWITDRSWTGVARRWDGMLRALVASGVYMD